MLNEILKNGTYKSEGPSKYVPSKHEQITIKGVVYERWIYEDEVLNHWTPEKNSANPYICGTFDCGSTSFQVLGPDTYETTAKCTKCGLEATVHSG